MFRCYPRHSAGTRTPRAEPGSGGTVKRLGGWDAILLYNETPNLHQHTLKIAVVDASGCDDFGFDRFRQTLARRLHLLEPLRYRLVDIPGRIHREMWLENCDVDLDYHVRRLQVSPPGGRRELDDAIGGRCVHSAGPQPTAVGVLLRRGHGGQQICHHRQGPPRARRRRRLGQPDGPRAGSAERPTVRT